MLSCSIRHQSLSDMVPHPRKRETSVGPLQNPIYISYIILLVRVGRTKLRGIVIRTGALDASVPPCQAKVPSVAYGLSQFLKEKLTQYCHIFPNFNYEYQLFEIPLSKWCTLDRKGKKGTSIF